MTPPLLFMSSSFLSTGFALLLCSLSGNPAYLTTILSILLCCTAITTTAKGQYWICKNLIVGSIKILLFQHVIDYSKKDRNRKKDNLDKKQHQSSNMLHFTFARSGKG